MADFLNPFLLSLCAGASTTIGGAYAIFVKKLKSNTMGGLLGFSAGIMLIISFINLMPEAQHVMASLWNPPVLLAIFVAIGICTMMLIDLKVPHIESAACDVARDGKSEFGLSIEHHDQLYHLGLLLIIGLTIHNLPEGLVVGTSYAYQPQFGNYVTFAIIFHKIPEGVAIATALIASSHRPKWQIMALTFCSSLTAPLGAMIGVGLIDGLNPILGNLMTGFSLAFTAGMMVYITTDQLIPTARLQCTKKHTWGIGILLGMMFILFLTALIPPTMVV